MRCKIVRFQKLMWRNMIRLTKSKKSSVLHYSIDIIEDWGYYNSMIYFIRLYF